MLLKKFVKQLKNEKVDQTLLSEPDFGWETMAEILIDSINEIKDSTVKHAFEMTGISTDITNSNSKEKLSNDIMNESILRKEILNMYKNNDT